MRATKDAAVYVRPDMIEQYSVSTDGVRQDFIITQRPPGAGDRLSIELAVTGARAETASYGAKLIITATGRELSYARLKVTDATGMELHAAMEAPSADRLRVRVDDTAATYPVRIDPTFSDADWIVVNPGLSGADDEVYAIVADAGGNLYFGGDFNFIGTTAASCIAKWDGSRWSTLGAGIESNFGYGVRTLAVGGGYLYAGGFFKTAGGVSTNFVARWDGTAWSPLGTGTDGGVYALAVNGSDLYAGGSFTAAGGAPAQYIAKWNGTSWSALGTGMNAWVYALAASGGSIYAGGEFGIAGGVNTGHAAKWDGNGWSALGAGPSEVHAFVIDGATLYAGGYGVQKWDGATWSNLPFGENDFAGVVYALALKDGELYAGGRFTPNENADANSIAKWNGVAWQSLGSGMGGGFSISFPVYALAVRDGELYAGGSFGTAGDVGANNVAKWDGSTWSALVAGIGHRAVGLYPSVSALVMNGVDLYVGGTFTTVGGVNASHVAKWNGSKWSPLGSGVNFIVNALAANGPDLYAGGWFTTAGGESANYVARWNGTAWSPLGSGLSGSPYNTHVDALAVKDGDLYAGGEFTAAGGVTVNNIARWNGSAWSALGSGVDAWVSSLAVTGSGNLYAGGTFATAGGLAANCIARWDGSSWFPLGSGMSGSSSGSNPRVSALAVSGSDLYAGGWFSLAGGVNVGGIAKWNGSTWSALGSGMISNVSALAANGNNLYAGGWFSSDGGLDFGGVANWDGSAWSYLGRANGTVSAMALRGSDLYVGGDFFTVGGTFSPFVARANLTGGSLDSDGDGLLDQWEIAHFAFRDAHGPSDDNDHDGYNNLLEEALGLDPLVSNAGGHPSIVREGGYLTMTVTKQPGVSYEVQSAGTLEAGQPDSFSPTSTTVLVNDGTTLKVRDNLPATAPSRRFVRVKVTAAP
ncbi:MAG: hypothetical protein K1X78_00315 [Verrucomicrobiaceae bacterium]|nr:hypothetical protein [Verrucomicrobiaceae bacterium]